MCSSLITGDIWRNSIKCNQICCCYFREEQFQKLTKKLNGSCFTAEKFTLTETRHRGTLFNCITFQTEEYVISKFDICSKECVFLSNSTGIIFCKHPNFNAILLLSPPIEWWSIFRLAPLSGPTKSCDEICAVSD